MGGHTPDGIIGGWLSQVSCAASGAMGTRNVDWCRHRALTLPRCLYLLASFATPCTRRAPQHALQAQLCARPLRHGDTHCVHLPRFHRHGHASGRYAVRRALCLAPACVACLACCPYRMQHQFQSPRHLLIYWRCTSSHVSGRRRRQALHPKFRETMTLRMRLLTASGRCSAC